MSASRSSNQLVVPQATAALDQMKYEVAQELGIAIPQDGYYGNMALKTRVPSGDTLLVAWCKSLSNPLLVNTNNDSLQVV